MELVHGGKTTDSLMRQLCRLTTAGAGSLGRSLLLRGYRQLEL